MITPKNTPKKIPKNPITAPEIIKILNIELFTKPIDLNIAISLDLFLIKIVKTDIMLKAATIIINVSIINITLRSTSSASKNVLLVSTQE